MTKYIINNTEVSRETYFDILNDLIDLAKDGMPLEIQFTPIPATHEAFNLSDYASYVDYMSSRYAEYINLAVLTTSEHLGVNLKSLTVQQVDINGIIHTVINYMERPLLRLSVNFPQNGSKCEFMCEVLFHPGFLYPNTVTLTKTLEAALASFQPGIPRINAININHETR